MADFEVKITSRSSSSDRLARRQRVLDHLAQSRRARQSSNIDDRSAAARARIQRRLATRRGHSATGEARDTEAVRQAETAPETRPGAGRLPPDEAMDPSSAQAWRESLARLRDFNWADAAFAGQVPDIAGQAAAPRGGRAPGPAATVRGSESDVARLQAKASAETQRADTVVALLENVLSASTARIIQHQARLEAMQAQINALQGR